MTVDAQESGLFDTLKRIIQAECDEPLGDYALDSRLDSLGLSSLQRIRIMLSLERTFSIEIDEDAALEMATVRDLLEHVKHASADA